MSGHGFYCPIIERFGDTAVVKILHVVRDGEQYHRRTVAEYETTSRGATASARREIKRISEQVLL